MFTLDAYLDRIGVARDTRDLAAIHRAHTMSIPFENLDPRRGVPVSLDVDDIAAKLVDAGRGGYCFEQNLLLKAALEALGARVDVYLARVRLGAEPGNPRPRGHVVLGVQAPDGGPRLQMDVGFGAGTQLEPLAFGPGEAVEQSGWRLRVVQDSDGELILQGWREERWTDLYGFAPQPVPAVDLATSNWFVCTHPHSPFVAGLIVSRREADGRWITLSDWTGLSLTEQSPTGVQRSEVSLDDVPALLESRFGLSGFVVEDDSALVPA